MIGGLGWPELVIIALLLAGFGFWIWMIVDCATNEKDSGTKIAWILVLIFIGFIGAPLYFLVRKLPRKSATIRS